MSDIKDPSEGITLGEYSALASIAEHHYEAGGEEDQWISQLIDRGLIVPIPNTQNAYELTEEGQRAYEKSQKEWDRARESITKQVAESLRATDFLRESASLLAEFARNALQDQVAAGGIASLVEQLQRCSVPAWPDSISSVLRQAYPPKSVLDSIAALRSPVGITLSAIANLSSASAHISLAEWLPAQNTLLLAASRNLTQSILNSPSFHEGLHQSGLWAGYLDKLNDFSKSVADLVKGIEPSWLTSAYTAGSLDLVGRTTYIASVPPAYSFAESEQAQVHIAESLYSATYADSEINARMAKVGSKYCDMWGGIMFAMNHRNPARVKQVVYTAREMIQTYIDEFAPNALVEEQLGKTNVSRRERIRFLMDPDTREQIIWVLDYLDSLIASLDATMSKLGHDKRDERRDQVNLKALVGLIANAMILLDNNRRR